jgi:hypothetical protein
VTLLRWLAITLTLALALTVYRQESATQQALVLAEHVADSSNAVALRAVAQKRRAEQALAHRYTTAQAHSDGAIAHFSAISTRLPEMIAQNAAPDSAKPGGLTVADAFQPASDSVVPVQYARAIADAGHAAIDSLLAERSVATARIGTLRALVAAQDTALTRADAVIAANRALVAASQCRIWGVPCPSRRVVFAVGLVVPMLVRLTLR